MPTRLPDKSICLPNTAAAARQPVGSTTIFMVATKKRMASMSSASETVSTSATSARMIGKVSCPGYWVCAPSAMVFGTGMRTISPLRNDCRTSSPASGSTAITLQPGASACAESAEPDTSPPPPVQTNR